MIKSNSAVIDGGIKSLDPPCLGKASLVGNHPYTCENCWKQRIDLINLLKRRENAKLLTEGSRVGASGFRKTYASQQEAEFKLDKVTQEILQLKRENKSLQRFCYDRKSWEEMLSEACDSCNEEKLVIDLLALLVQSPKTLQLEVLKNLIGKMKSGSNYRYTYMIKDISAIHKNRPRQTNYSILQDLIGFCGKAIAVAHAFKDQLQPGINHNVIAKVSNVCYKEPVIECSDEARTLQFLSPCNSGRVAELVGECWDPDIDKWSKCRRIAP